MSNYSDIAAQIRRSFCIADGQVSNDEARSFYEHIRDGYAEAIEWAEGKPDEDAVTEIADGAPSIYNWTRMMEAIGTGAYLEPSDLASGEEDMVTLAGYVLYELAERVLYELGERYDEIAEELDDDAEDEDA